MKNEDLGQRLIDAARGGYVQAWLIEEFEALSDDDVKALWLWICEVPYKDEQGNLIHGVIKERKLLSATIGKRVLAAWSLYQNGRIIC